MKTNFIKFIILFSFCSVYSICADAQTNEKISVVTTINGPKYTGKIVERKSDYILLALHSSTDTIKIARSIISIIYKHDTIDDKILIRKGNFHLKEGFVSSVNIGLSFATRQLEYHGYHILNSRVALGGGVGILSQMYEFYSLKAVRFVDVFLYGKYFITEGNYERFFFDAKYGYDIELNDTKYSSGTLLQLGFGFEFPRRTHARPGVSISGFYHNSSDDFNDRYNDTDIIGAVVRYSRYF